MRAGITAIALVLVSTLAACWAEPDDDDTSSVESASVVDNGVNLNGVNLNGVNLNGSSVLGSVIKWVKYTGATLGNDELDNVELEGSQLVGKRNHQSVSGTQLVGARFRGRSDTGNHLDLRITAAFAPGPNDDPTTWRYFVEYQEVNSSWVPICVSGTDPVPAIPVDGYWDLHAGDPGDGGKITIGQKFLFACEQVGAIGKCIEAGYRPWQRVDHHSLDRYHQTCVRLLRADFCGTSTPHTVDGSFLNIYDDLGVQLDTEDWIPEGEWDRHGARCISPDATTADIENVECYEDLLDDDCALDFGHRTLMITERP